MNADIRQLAERGLHADVVQALGLLYNRQAEGLHYMIGKDLKIQPRKSGNG